MSYFDDASLAFLPSGAAGKDGKAYSIKPVPVYGSELVTNGDFATDSDWTKQTGWTISGGKAIVTNAPNLYQRLTQSSLSFNLNSTYKISITCSEYSSGFVYLRKPRGAEPDTNLRIDSVGTSVFTLNALTELNEFALAIGALGTDLKIDNISVKEVLVGDGDFTFSRGSNLAATRVDADGLIEKGRENLLLQSNQFDTTWLQNRIDLTSGQSGYDGGSDAWKLESNNASTTYLAQNVVGSGVQTASAYAKAGTANYLTFYNSSGASVWFNLSNGSLGNTNLNIDTKIEAVGSDGWYRCSMTFNVATSYLRVYVTDVNGSFPSAIGANILIQDAQLESGLVATDVIETTTTTGTAGILENTPRFNYSNGASCPSLLLEPSRTNLIAQSEYFGGSYWSTGSGIITDNAILSPEGLQNATKVIPSSGDSGYSFRTAQNASVLIGINYTFSVFAKKGEFDKVELDFSDLRFGDTNVVADLTNGTVTAGPANVDEGIEDYGNGWFRIYVVGVALSSGTSARIVRLGDNPTGDGTSGLYLWGFQFTASSYISSYIPNHSGGTVTRAADVCSKTGISNLINSVEGTLFVEISLLNDDDTSKVIGLSDGSSSNYIHINFDYSSSRIQYAVVRDGVVEVNIKTNYIGTNMDKFAIKWKVNDFALWLNGTEIGTKTSGGTPINLSQLQFALYNGISNRFYGNVNQVLTFNTALSDSELAALTTI